MATPSARKTAAENASPDERAAAGKAARAEAPRSSHGEWGPAADRLSPVELISRQDATRVPELVPLRHGRMLASAFTFYRGAAGIMAADLANTRRSGLEVQACGDAHLSNFGAFAAPDRELMFDVNDFDETLPGPWEWDLKRLVASFEIAGRDRDFGRKDRRAAVLSAARSYRETMRRLAPLSNLDVWYVRIDVDRIRQERAGKATKREQRMFEKSVTKARSKTRLKAFEKLTHRVDGELRIINDPPLVVPLEDLLSPAESERADEALRAIVGSYRDSLMPDRRRLFDTYRYVHVARKVVGVGSVGTRAWIALFVGRDEGDPLFLQIKEAEESVLEPYVGASSYRHHGKRVVEGQRLTQAASDIMLGWLTAEGPDQVERQFYVRQLWDAKGSAQIDSMMPAGLTTYAEICGATLARAHARSGDRIAIGSYLGGGDGFDRAMVSFADSYADQNKRDYDEMKAAVRDGRIEVEEEP